MFKPTFHDIPLAHRVCLIAMLAIIALPAVVFFGFVQPEQRSTRNTLRAEIEQMQKRLTSSSWPISRDLLDKRLDEAKCVLNGEPDTSAGLVSAADAAIAQATGTFRENILEKFPDTLQFINGVTRIDFKDLADRAASYFTAQGIAAPPEILGLNEDNQGPVYQMMFKLWTARRLVRLALECNLKISENENTAEISALPPIAYTTGDQPNTPAYLLEFPVRVVLIGKPEDFLQFVKRLQSEEQFLPLKQLSVNTMPPAPVKSGEENAVETARFTVVCSSFFQLH